MNYFLVGCDASYGACLDLVLFARPDRLSSVSFEKRLAEARM
jgi:hypothetical protein